jgi:hypothetical protein
MAGPVMEITAHEHSGQVPIILTAVKPKNPIVEASPSWLAP